MNPSTFEGATELRKIQVYNSRRHRHRSFTPQGMRSRSNQSTPMPPPTGSLRERYAAMKHQWSSAKKDDSDILKASTQKKTTSKGTPLPTLTRPVYEDNLVSCPPSRNLFGRSFEDASKDFFAQIKGSRNRVHHNTPSLSSESDFPPRTSPSVVSPLVNDPVSLPITPERDTFRQDPAVIQDHEDGGIASEHPVSTAVIMEVDSPPKTAQTAQDVEATQRIAQTLLELLTTREATEIPVLSTAATEIEPTRNTHDMPNTIRDSHPTSSSSSTLPPIPSSESPLDNNKRSRDDEEIDVGSDDDPTPKNKKQRLSKKVKNPKNKGTHPCPDCDKIFTRDFDRKRHIALTHLVRTQEEKLASTCSDGGCNTLFARRDSYKRHLLALAFPPLRQKNNSRKPSKHQSGDPSSRIVCTLDPPEARRIFKRKFPDDYAKQMVILGLSE